MKGMNIFLAAALFIHTALCGQSQPTDPFLIVPGVRAGHFFLNQSYEPLEKLYKGYGFSQQTDDWLNVNILRNSEKALAFSPMFVAGGDERIPNTVGNSLLIESSDFRTAEGLGVGSSLRDLLNHYPKYIIQITYTPEEDEAPLKRAEFEDVESLFKTLSQDGFDGIDYYGTSFICLDAKGEKAGISFVFTMEQTDNPVLDVLTKESKVTAVFIHSENWTPEPDIWM